MGKRKETIELEEALIKNSIEKRIYGCEEVTIGFANKGKGNEAVDFISMDSKGIIRCYEIKVSIQDLKSKAKKSWYGNYNYLVVSKELLDEFMNKKIDWALYLPKDVGLLAGKNLTCIFKPKKQKISAENEVMLKESMVRSMFYKMNKYMDSQDIEKQKEMLKKINYWEKEYRREHQERLTLYRKIYSLERLIYNKTNKRISIDDLLEKEEINYNKQFLFN